MVFFSLFINCPLVNTIISHNDNEFPFKKNRRRNATEEWKKHHRKQFVSFNLFTSRIVRISELCYLIANAHTHTSKRSGTAKHKVWFTYLLGVSNDFTLQAQSNCDWTMTNRQAFRSFAHWLFVAAQSTAQHNRAVHSMEHTALAGAIISLVDFVWHFMFGCVYTRFPSIRHNATLERTLACIRTCNSNSTDDSDADADKDSHRTNRDSSIALALFALLFRQQ